MAEPVDLTSIQPERLLTRTVAMIGYGNQGRAQALNLRDSGAQVVVGLPTGSKSRERAEQDGMPVDETAGAVEKGDFVVLCTPDMKMPAIFRASVAPALHAGKVLVFAHGFNIAFGLIPGSPRRCRAGITERSGHRRPPEVRGGPWRSGAGRGS